MDNADALRQVLERGFGQGDLSVADEFAGATIVEHEYGAPDLASGPETLKAQIREARTEIADLTITIEDLVVDGDKVWTRSVGRGTHSRTGQAVTLTIFDVCRYQLRLMSSAWLRRPGVTGTRLSGHP